MVADVVSTQWDRPLPEIDSDSAEFYASAARGTLLIQACPVCGHRQFYPRVLCTQCGGAPEWLECDGKGEVYTFTVVRQVGIPPFNKNVPYVIAMIRLTEGILMLGELTDCDPDQVSIGDPVEVYMALAAPELGIPFWRPRTA